MEQDNPSTIEKSSLVHNIRWAEFVFKSKEVAEDLLFPERESGNLTSADYERAIDFLPGTQNLRPLPMIGLLLGGASAAFLVKMGRPNWPARHKWLAMSTSAFVGYAGGNVARIKAHADYLRSIEDPVRYAEAMRNVESRIGIKNSSFFGPTFQGMELLRDNTAKEPTSIILPGSSAMNDTPKPQAGVSKWEEIRKANSNSAQTSSWDNLRQQHERHKINTAQPQSGRGRDGTLEDKLEAVETHEHVDPDRFADSGDKYLPRQLR